MRLGFLFPPCGGEDELYSHGEAMGEDVRILLTGSRIYGGDDEHAPEHLRRTGALEHLAMHARVMARLHLDAAIWACTSGSFIDGLAHAQAQARTLSEITGVPASSTSLAFVSALKHLGRSKAALLASYPEPAANAFRAYLGECGIEVTDMVWLSAPSGPAAAALGRERLMEAARKLDVSSDCAVLVPDTAMPSIHLIPPLEDELGVPVLTANQVSLWEAVRLVERRCARPGPGRLFASSP